MAKRRDLSKEQYEKIAYLARRLVSKKEIARTVGYSESAFYKRLKKDATLRNALQVNYNQGKIGLYVASYRKSIDHHYTICKECHKIADGEWYDSCPFCDEEDPLEKGNHKHVTHRLVEADTGMLIHMCKHHLGQTDKSLLVVKSDRDNPLVFKNLLEEQIDKRLEDLAIVLQKEYGQPKEPGHDELLINVQKFA